MREAGGVGGLLSITRHSTLDTLYPSYGGNGNITCYACAAEGGMAASGTKVDEVVYSPFGKIVSGSLSVCPFGFSSKYVDEEDGLVYYGFRSYSPSLGRFINRDPIDVEGGWNLYTNVFNNLINRIDLLGLKQDCCNGVPFDTETHCCENKIVVAKVKIIKCKRPMGLYHWTGIGRIPGMEHIVFMTPAEYQKYLNRMQGKRPNNIWSWQVWPWNWGGRKPQAIGGPTCYGKQCGNSWAYPLWGPGISEKDDITKYTDGDYSGCSEMKVCPEEAKSKMKTGNSGTYFFAWPFGKKWGNCSQGTCWQSF